MNLLAASFSGASFLISLGTWVAYLGRVPSGNVPLRPFGSIFMQCIALTLAGMGITVGVQAGTTADHAAMAPAVFTLITAGLFLWLLTQRKTPVGKLQVAVGDTLLPFTTLTDAGVPFSTEDLVGKRTLLKFFRGSW